jgi:Zn-dependent M16 (insulinase) family peptidase
MIQTPKNGLIGFTSYRDPEIARTNKVYEEVVDYIRNLNPTDEELLKYKIGAIGSLDQVLHVSSKGALAQNNYLAGFTYELQAKYRKEAIEATKEDLVNLASCFKQALSTKNICVIGNQNKIEANKEMFDNIRNLTK